MVEFLGRRLLEAEDLAALRIHAGHDVLDGAVLAGGVHRLKNQQHRPGVVGVNEFLDFGELLPVLLQDLQRALLDFVAAAELLRLFRAGPVGGEFLQVNLGARGDVNSLTNFCLIMVVDVLLLRDERHRRWVARFDFTEVISFAADDGVPGIAAPTRARLLRDHRLSAVRSKP